MAVQYGDRRIRAVLFDLDGTLYRQRPLRLRMIRELLLLPVRTFSIRRTRRVLQCIRAFRNTREELRALGQPEASLERMQYELPARRIGCDCEELEALVVEWMHRRPLRHLARYLYPGAKDLLDDLHARGTPAGVFSDYAPAPKLEALGLAHRFTLLLCATDPSINAFKPHPRGFLRACEEWGLEPCEVLYVGDRPDVDAAGATAAGLPCAIIGTAPDGPGYRCFPGYRELRAALR